MNYKGHRSEQKRTFIQAFTAFVIHLNKHPLYPRKRGILVGEGILAHGPGYSLRLPISLILGTVAISRFPASSHRPRQSAALKFFLYYADAEEKKLPFTVAGPQWICTIFPSCEIPFIIKIARFEPALRLTSESCESMSKQGII